MNTDILAPWVFVVDTEQYSGDFERPLTAWITGCVGECKVGDAEAELARGELPGMALRWFEDHVLSLPDEHGCQRPTSIWETPGWFNDGHGNAWRKGSDPKAVRRKYEASSRAYYTPLIKATEERAGSEPTSSWGQQEERLKKALAEDLAKGPGQCPSYQSVAIFLDSEPPPDILTLMKDRAAAYNRRPGREEWETRIIITGFRLIKQRVQRRTKKV